MPSLDLTEIWVFQDDAAPLTLTKTSSLRWETMTIIKMSNTVQTMHCVIKTSDGDDLAFVYLESNEMRIKGSGFYQSKADGGSSRPWPYRAPLAPNHSPFHMFKVGHTSLDSTGVADIPSTDPAFFNAAAIGTARLELGDTRVVANALATALNSLPSGPGPEQQCWETATVLFTRVWHAVWPRFEPTAGLQGAEILKQDVHSALTPEGLESWKQIFRLALPLFLKGNVYPRSPDDPQITLLRLAVRFTARNDPLLPLFLSRLGCALSLLFESTLCLSYVEEAVAVLRSALALSLADGPLLKCTLIALGTSLVTLSHHTQSLTGIEEAISVLQTCVNAPPIGHIPFHSLGMALRVHFEITGRLSDINESITAHRCALGLVAAFDVPLSTKLHELGAALTRRFEHTSDLSDLEEGIVSVQRAFEKSPESDGCLRYYLYALGVLLVMHFKSTGDLSDLAEAISVHHRAMEAAPEGDPRLYIGLENLACALSLRWGRAGDLEDLHGAVTLERRALEVGKRSGEGVARILGNLGMDLTHLWKVTGQFSDLEEAISVQRKAIELAPVGDSRIAQRFYRLGIVWQRRFDETGAIEDLTNAVSALMTAVQATPHDRTDYSAYFSAPGSALMRRYIETRSSAGGSGDDMASIRDATDGLASLRLAAKSGVGPVVVRLQGAHLGAMWLIVIAPQSPDIFTALDTALDLLALVGGLEQTIRTRHVQLRSKARIALQAASTACAFERPDKALEWLEQGRCLVWNQINHLRTPLDGLCPSNPRLAETIMDVSRRLENAAGGTTPSSASHAWVRIVPPAGKIHTLFQDLPKGGIIVVVNVYKGRCDAIALRAESDKPLHIQLRNFSEEKARAYQNGWGLQLKARRLRMRGEDSVRAMESYRQPRSTPIRRVLRGLWTDVVRPILDMLAISKFEQRPGEQPPRIWWCPTGALSFLPLHAAGIYSPGVGPETVLDYAVSSYTPTVSALTERVRNSRPIDEAVSGLFLTSQPNAPRTVPIPGTTTEVRSIYEKAKMNGTRALEVEGSDLTVDDCLNHLEGFSSVHLACHGYQNPEESLQSRFCFHNGTLDLASILRKNLKDADLAFLSSCQTSTGDNELPDEAVHLVAGMLAAGYRRVVGTMWCIGDKTAQDVSMSLYDWLFDRMEPGSGFDGTLSAYALHHAIQKLRGDIGDTDGAILAWAPFVHWGY
ncbi:hypothetical protein FA13DRAFT_1860478 [Coprinellus micaceus]|uniref:CHAT domain-containing protein n=1 Tax=Coprinellus micaceus TaxID=71717 RepID=A0A4Y7T6J6_COPMI|nr:hypothetical protein FA13DRAFT_1860478 [Coprinellus micaceus]